MKDSKEITNIILLSYLTRLLGFKVFFTEAKKLFIVNEEFDINFIFPFLEPSKQVLERHISLICKMVDDKGLIAKSIFEKHLAFFATQITKEEKENP